jgi:hypothetical protein
MTSDAPAQTGRIRSATIDRRFRQIRLRVFFTKIDDAEELIISTEQFLFLRLLVRNPTNAAVLNAIKDIEAGLLHGHEKAKRVIHLRAASWARRPRTCLGGELKLVL